MRKFLLLISLIYFNSSGQDYPRGEIDPSKIADELVNFQDEDLNYEDAYEKYLQLYASPVNLNKATADELRSTGILNEIQVLHLLQHITKVGKLISMYELQSIAGFDIQTIHRLAPFVIVSSPDSEFDRKFFRKIFARDYNYFVARIERTLEESVGYRRKEYNGFEGSPDKVYMRIRSSRANDFSFGVTTEKDAGEKTDWNPASRRYGFDFLSSHFQVMNKKRLTNLVIGDYQFQFGQGLILGNGFGLGKGSEAITGIRKVNLGFSPYTSATESGYLRGAGATLKLSRHFYLSPFYSNTLRDATINQNDSTVSSFISSGLHRNFSEQLKRKNVREKMYGGVLNFRRKNSDAGLIFQAIGFDTPLAKFPSPYNQFAFRGKANINGGLFLNYTYQNANFFSEAARSSSGGMGIVAGALISISAAWDFSILFRKYDVDFHTFYANALSENSTPQNETAFFWGVKYRINKKYSFSGYLDIFRFPWLRFRSYSPSTGNEFLFRFNYQPSRKNLVFVQFRQETKDRNLREGDVTYKTSEGTKRNLTINFEYEIFPSLKLRTRGQFSEFEFIGKKTQGMTIFQDMVWSTGKLKFSGRHAIFDTDDFDNRQYAYEKDVWLAFAFPAYYGKGIRNYLIAEYKAGKNVSIALRYSRTYYRDRDEIGSGLNKIEGNKRNDVKLQTVFRF